MSEPVVYVASMPFSGSTLLGLLLGGHPKMVGIGEAFRLLRPDRDFLSRSGETVCSCGKVMDECEFWRPVCEELRRRTFDSLSEKYRMVLRVFREVFGRDRVAVDTSKYLPFLRVLHEMPDIDLKVVHLVRDVRGYGLSARKASRRSNRFSLGQLVRAHGAKAGLYYLGRTWLGLMLHWRRNSKRMNRYLERENIPTFQLGYEELCLHADRMIPKLCEFLGAEPVPDMYSPRNSHSHDALGNASRFQSDKRAGLFYSNRWCYETEWLLPAALLRGVMRFNARQVYSNTHGVLWEKR